MSYEYVFSSKFAEEFAVYPADQQDKILDFIRIFESVGLADFSLYPGKISHSWAGLEPHDPNYQYAEANALWHYHVGIPEFQQTHEKYQTSDWVLHFQWPDQGDFVKIVDIYSHYDRHGNFYMPPGEFLLEA